MAGGSKPGERRGGRQKGTPNRRTQEVADKLAALDCDPIEGMARIAEDTANPPPTAGAHVRRAGRLRGAKAESCGRET
jgi:hypothetical protein